MATGRARGQRRINTSSFLGRKPQPLRIDLALFTPRDHAGSARIRHRAGAPPRGSSAAADSARIGRVLAVLLVPLRRRTAGPGAGASLGPQPVLVGLLPSRRQSGARAVRQLDQRQDRHRVARRLPHELQHPAGVLGCLFEQPRGAALSLHRSSSRASCPCRGRMRRRSSACPAPTSRTPPIPSRARWFHTRRRRGATNSARRRGWCRASGGTISTPSTSPSCAACTPC